MGSDLEAPWSLPAVLLIERFRSKETGMRNCLLLMGVTEGCEVEAADTLNSGAEVKWKVLPP